MKEHFLLKALGFSMLSINYRGSLGFGLQNLNCLPGKIGE